MKVSVSTNGYAVTDIDMQNDEVTHALAFIQSNIIFIDIFSFKRNSPVLGVKKEAERFPTNGLMWEKVWVQGIQLHFKNCQCYCSHHIFSQCIPNERKLSRLLC